jgi:hypothetical protein
MSKANRNLLGCPEGRTSHGGVSTPRGDHTGHWPTPNRRTICCSRGFGESLLMSREMAGRYACAEVLFNGPELASDGTR